MRIKGLAILLFCVAIILWFAAWFDNAQGREDWPPIDYTIRAVPESRIIYGGEDSRYYKEVPQGRGTPIEPIRSADPKDIKDRYYRPAR